MLLGKDPFKPRSAVRPFHQKSICITQLTLRPYVAQIWARNTPEYGPIVILVHNRAICATMRCFTNLTTDTVSYPAKMAHVRQTRPDSGHGFQVKVLNPFEWSPLRSEAVLSNMHQHDMLHESAH